MAENAERERAEARWRRVVATMEEAREAWSDFQAAFQDVFDRIEGLSERKRATDDFADHIAEFHGQWEELKAAVSEWAEEVPPYTERLAAAGQDVAEASGGLPEPVQERALALAKTLDETADHAKSAVATARGVWIEGQPSPGDLPQMQSRVEPNWERVEVSWERTEQDWDDTCKAAKSEGFSVPSGCLALVLLPPLGLALLSLLG